MAEIFSIGIIGIGMMGQNHIEFLQQSKVCKLTALCARRADSFSKIKPELIKNVRCYTDYEDFLSDHDIDIVLIATPHRSHAGLAIKALQHNKHLLIEKPVAVHKKEADQLIAEAAKHPDLAVSVLFNQRTWPLHCKIKAMLEANELGRIQRVTWVSTDWFRTQHYFDSNSWRATWSGEGGGVLLNQSIHQLDLLQWYFGLPETVHSIVKLGKYHQIEVEDDVNVLLEYSDGKVINFITSTGETPGINRLEIIGENGLLIMENEQLRFRRNTVASSKFIAEAAGKMYKPDSEEIVIPVESKDTLPYFGYPLLIENTVKAITSGEKLLVSLSESVRSLELANAILYAGLKKQSVALPLDAQSFSDLLDELILQASES